MGQGALLRGDPEQGRAPAPQGAAILRTLQSLPLELRWELLVSLRHFVTSEFKDVFGPEEAL